MSAPNPLDGVRYGAPAAPDELAALECTLSLPRAYRDFLATSDGASGWVGPVFVQLWTARELVANHANYQVGESSPS